MAADRIPGRDRAGGATTLRSLACVAEGGHSGVPPGWHEMRHEIGQGCQDEEPICGIEMRHFQPLGHRMRRIRAPARGRAHRVDAMAAEDEQVQVEFAWPPATTGPAAERRLQALEGEEEGEGTSLGVGTGRRVESHDSVMKVGLVEVAHGSGDVEVGDAPQVRARQHGQGGYGGGQRHRRVADIGTQTDVRPNWSRQRRHLI